MTIPKVRTPPVTERSNRKDERFTCSSSWSATSCRATLPVLVVPQKQVKRKASTTCRLKQLATLAVLYALTAPLAIAQDKAASQAEVDAALKVLDHWRGRWKIEMKTTSPSVTTVTSVTTNSWVLGKRFLQGDSGIKSDGQHDMSMMTFDAIRRAYPLWIFTSSGVVYYLADGQWDEASRTMNWDSPISMSGSYTYRCRFADNDHYRCNSRIRSAMGSVLLDLEVYGTRLQE